MILKNLGIMYMCASSVYSLEINYITHHHVSNYFTVQFKLHISWFCGLFLQKLNGE
jgi:hypothetical protein